MASKLSHWTKYFKKNSMIRLIKILVVLLTPCLMLAQETSPAASPEKVKQAFMNMNQSMQSFSSDFKQSKELSFMNKPLISTGKFYYQKEDKLRWEYLEPIQYLMLINGEQIRIKEDGKVKNYSSSVNEIFKTVKEIILGCISGDILNNPDYSASYFENNELFEVSLQPKKKELQSFMKEVHIYIKRDKNTLSHLVLVDGSGDKTTIEFISPSINQTIPAAVFEKL